MRVLHGFDGWPAAPLHLAIGVFDGVQRGHQELIRRLRVFAHRQGGLAVVCSFDPLPIQVLAPGAPPSALTDSAERAELLTSAGADAVVFFRSEPALFAMRATEFIDRIRAAGDVRRIVVGEDFRFGRDREGDVRTLAEIGGTHRIDVDVVPAVMSGEAVISSTRIRNLLLGGDVGAAADLLGRPYSVRGAIVHGDKRGRALGYPTIIVATPAERLLPRDGIYATRVTLGSEVRPAATILGVRPTFGGGERRLEAFILDHDGDLYGEEVMVTFVARLRDELRFESPEALTAQIARDVEATRQALRSFRYTGRE